MQARLEVRRFPTALAALLVAIVAALLVGGSLGYVLKPAAFVNGPTRVVYVAQPSSNTYDPNADACIWVNHHKEC